MINSVSPKKILNSTALLYARKAFLSVQSFSSNMKLSYLSAFILQRLTIDVGSALVAGFVVATSCDHFRVTL